MTALESVEDLRPRANEWPDEPAPISNNRPWRNIGVVAGLCTPKALWPRVRRDPAPFSIRWWFRGDVTAEVGCDHWTGLHRGGEHRDRHRSSDGRSRRSSRSRHLSALFGSRRPGRRANNPVGATGGIVEIAHTTTLPIRRGCCAGRGVLSKTASQLRNSLKSKSGDRNETR